MEFLGTFFLVFVIAMTGNAVAIAAMLMAMVYIGGHISGGHYNPAVTLTMAFKHGIPFLVVPSYIAAQTAGSIVALLAAASIKQTEFLPAPGVGILFAHALSIEIMLTFVLCMVVLTMVSSPALRGNQVYGFAIGFTILALAYIGNPISGGLFNPAIIFGAMFVALIKGSALPLTHLVIYAVGPLFGAAGAYLTYNYLNNER